MGRLSVNDHKLINVWELGELVSIKFKDGREGTYKILLFDVETRAVIMEPPEGGDRVRIETDDIESVDFA